MTTISGDDGHTGWRKFDIDCRNALPVSIAFTDDSSIIVSAERNFNHSGGKLRRHHIPMDESKERNVPKNSDAIVLDGIDRAAVSKDGKWVVIVSGTSVTVRNMITDEVVEVGEHTSGVPVRAVDISPDSTKFATGSQDKIIRVFSVNTGKLLHKLNQHKNSVLGVRYSPNGHYLATAAYWEPILKWDARNNYALLQTSYGTIRGPSASTDSATHIPTSTPLGWSCHGDCVFTISYGVLVMFQSSLWTSPSSSCYHYGQGPEPGTVRSLPASLPQDENSTSYSLATNGRIIACAIGGSLSFCDIFSSSMIGPTITFQDSILFLALSFDGSYLACGKSDKKITVYLLRDILPLHFIVDPTFHLPLINVNYPTFQTWLESTTGKTLWQKKHPYTSSPGAANQALIYAHAQSWCNALQQARNSLAAEPSLIGYIALTRVLIGQGQKGPAFEALEAVFRTCGADENRFLLLIKAIFVFLSGKHEKAITRVKDLISSASDTEKYNDLQVLGNMLLMQGNWREAFESFERARSLSFSRRGHHLMTLLLIFGPSFEEREITLRHPLREAVTM